MKSEIKKSAAYLLREPAVTGRSSAAAFCVNHTRFRKLVKHNKKVPTSGVWKLRVGTLNPYNR
jgi:hypothetical protein